MISPVRYSVSIGYSGFKFFIEPKNGLVFTKTFLILLKMVIKYGWF